MSITLTWAMSALGTKTGTTADAFITDLVTLVNSNSGDAAFFWQVASSNTGSSPRYLVLKPKDGGAGRILLVHWSSAPAGNNAAILDSAPSATAVYISYFPAGNVDTPSNLTAASGTILGDDTGAVKVSHQISIASAYGSSLQPFYADCEEGVIIMTQNPASPGIVAFAAGDLLIDVADVAYPCVFAASTLNAFGTGSAPWAFTAVAQSAGSGTSPCIRSNATGPNRVYFSAWIPSGTQFNTAVGASDILTDTASSDAWFVPVVLLGQTKGEGFLLKLRQINYGPATVGAFTTYSGSGPVIQARSLSAATAGLQGGGWLTNFKT